MTRRALATVALVAVCVAFFGAALSRHVYHLTSPGTFAFYVELRKFYSIVAFTIVGTLLTAVLRRPTALASICGVAAFSALIEIAQTLDGVRESIPLHLFDVACGAVGGYLGFLVARSVGRRNT